MYRHKERLHKLIITCSTTVWLFSSVNVLFVIHWTNMQFFISVNVPMYGYDENTVQIACYMLNNCRTFLQSDGVCAWSHRMYKLYVTHLITWRLFSTSEFTENNFIAFPQCDCAYAWLAFLFKFWNLFCFWFMFNILKVVVVWIQFMFLNLLKL